MRGEPFGIKKGDGVPFQVDKPFVLSELVNPICVSLSPVDVLRKRVRVAGWGHLEHSKRADRYAHASACCMG